MTSPNLIALDADLKKEQEAMMILASSKKSEEDNSIDRHCVVAQAVIRRIVYACLDKYQNTHPQEEVEDALRYHKLPETLQQELVQRYGGSPAPETWLQALDRLKELCYAGDVSDKSKLWRLVLDHPMTSYIPVQCQSCGHHDVPDLPSTEAEDVAAGLSIVPVDGSEMGLRGGWFRGRPHSGNTVFAIACPKCSNLSRWYRSGHPKVILNPRNWGRLCGEQEELRLNLSSYLDIQIRTCVPLDWDHVWSEFQSSSSDSICCWEVLDDSARNFAVRLDEGIGSWAAVLAVSPDPAWCGDVTEEYLSCASIGGRVDEFHSPNMERYRQVVAAARTDSSGINMQGKTCNGYVVHRAKWTPEDTTQAMRQAARDYGTCPWWQVHNCSSAD